MKRIEDDGKPKNSKFNETYPLGKIIFEYKNDTVGYFDDINKDP